MCGLAGLCRLGSEGDAEHETAIVQTMCDRIAHRGSDDSGVLHRGSACLGSRRLSIIDLSPAGHMPMQDDSGRWAIAYNGEVYNFAAIREELRALGHDFRSATDTEVVLHAFMEWGQASMDRFIGLFAFAVHDADAGEVHLVRDRFGIKPLYYTVTERHVLFGSEMKALVGIEAAVRVDHRSLMEWMVYHTVDVLTPPTLLEDIRSVLPGEAIKIVRGELGRSQWYSPLRQVSRDAYRRLSETSPEAVVDKIGRTLEDAVRLRLISDVPVGTLLSGGLDSSVVTALAAKHSNDLTAFHVSVAGFPDLDERQYAEQLTIALDIPIVPLELTGETFRRNLVRVTHLSDLPLTHPNSIAYYLISQTARDHGVPVLLSGEGADELFGGYAWSYQRTYWLRRLGPLLRGMPRRIREIDLVAYASEDMPVTGHRFRDLLPAAVAAVDGYARRSWEEECEAAFGFVEKPAERAVLGKMVADLSHFLTPLLRRLDRTSMGATVECRVPFLDHRLVHEAINLPLAYKLGARANKWVLRQVAQTCPPMPLAKRKKMGFPLPLVEYVRPLASPRFFAGGFCETVLGMHPAGLELMVQSWERRIYAYFGMITLEVWGRLYVLDQSIEAVEQHVLEVEGCRAGGA